MVFIMKVFSQTITIFVALLMLLSVITVVPVTGSPAVKNPVYIQQSNTFLREWIWTEVNEVGDIYGNANLESNAMHLDVAGLDTLADIISFNRVDTWTYRSDNPWDRNLDFTFEFQTDQTSVAQFYADIIISAFGNNVLIDSLEFTGSEGYDANYGDGWLPYTRVYYNAHIDWTGLENVIDGVIPRELGGISETIDVFPSRSLQFNIWIENNEIVTSVGLEYNAIVPAQVGGFALSLKNLIPVSSFQVSPYSDGLNIHQQLPEVANLGYSVSNTPNTNVDIRHEPSSEPQNKIAYFTDITIHSPDSYSDITTSFDYVFTQWSWQNRENVRWQVDQRGYSQMQVEIFGEDRATLSSNLPINSSLFDNTLEVSLDIAPYMTIPGHDTQWLHVTFAAGTDFAVANATTQAIANAITAELGLPFTNNWNASNPWGFGYSSMWDEVTQSEIPTEVLYYSGRSVNTTALQSMMSSSYVYGKSAVMQASDLTEVRTVGWRVFNDRWGKGGEVSLRIRPMFPTFITPLTPFTQKTNTPVTVDLLNPKYLAWSGIPWNSYSEILEIDFETYYDGPFNDITFTPDSDNGFAWQSGRWTNYWNFPTFSYRISIFDANPLLLDQNGNTIGSLTSAQVTYDSYYYDLSTDLEAPWIMEEWYHTADFNNELNDYTNYHRMWNDMTINGTVDVTAEVSDENWIQYWNGTDWLNRVSSVGILNVTGYLYRSDAPVDHPLFTKDVIFTHNSSWVNDNPEHQTWDSTIDTWQLPDGEWNLWLNPFDNNGNKGHDERTFIVDNYNDSYQPADITWDPSAPANNSGVSDITWFNFTVTDDVGIFSVVAWNNLGGFILEPISSNAGSSTYAFKVDTLAQGLPENAYMAITIEVLDMDGHWSYLTLHVFIDNLHQGNPPTINLIAPTNGITINNTLTATQNFQADITDDWGIKHATITFTGPQTMTFDMFYNNSTGYYEFNADISKWAVGTYSWSVTTTDVDENEHTLTSGALSITIVGNAPVADTVRPVVSLTTPSDGDTVTGSVTIQATATDNVAVQQVSITLPDDSVKQMNLIGGNTYEYAWDSASVIDGTVSLKITATDTSGNTQDLSFSLTTNNGRTASTPDLGVPGFGFFTSLLAVAVIGIRKRKK